MIDSRRNVTTAITVVLLVASALSVIAVTGVSGAFITGDGNIGQAGNQGNTAKAISFIAFCNDDGLQRTDVMITDVTLDQDGELVSVSYEINSDIDTIVYKAGPELYQLYNPAVSGTVTTGEGTTVSGSEGVSSSSPCPNGESGLKFAEYDEESDEFEEIEYTD